MNTEVIAKEAEQGVNLIDQIIRYEEGEMDMEEVVAFFAKLVKTGMAWDLQGHYGRTASTLIRNGYIDGEGEILTDMFDEL